MGGSGVMRPRLPPAPPLSQKNSLVTVPWMTAPFFSSSCTVSWTSFMRKLCCVGGGVGGRSAVVLSGWVARALPAPCLSPPSLLHNTRKRTARV